MQCPKCGGRGRVNGTNDYGTTVQRYRRCPICDHRWRTWEEKDDHAVRAKARKAPSQDDLFAKSVEGSKP